MLHFTAEDYAARLGRTEAALAARGLDGLLLFGADSAYWLCGLDAGAPSGLTCLILGGVEPVLFLPAARALQARLTSNVEDIRPWHAAADADPAAGLAALLGELGLAGKRLGVETTALPAAEFLRLQAALDGTLRLAEGAGIVDALALVKSESELIYLRRAAGLADDSLDSALDRVRSGAESGRILAAMQETMLAGGGDCPALPMVAGAGKQALLTAPATGRPALSEGAALTLLWAGSYRHYHAPMMRTLVLGRVDSRTEELHRGAEAALRSATQALRPGTRTGAVYDAYAATLDEMGLGGVREDTCGHAVGAHLGAPAREAACLARGGRTEIGAGMTFFLRAALIDAAAGRVATLGHTVLVTREAAEPLSRHDLKLIHCHRTDAQKPERYR